MGRTAFNILLGLSAASVALAPAAASAAPLVVRSVGPSAKAYPPGKALSENTPLVLKAGDVLTVLVPSATRVLRGPGTFTLGGAARTVAAAFNPRSRFGAMRTNDVPPAPDLFEVDVSQSGNFCLADSTNVVLWRPAKDDPVTLDVQPSGGAAQKLQWAAGQATLPWPSQLPISEDAEYAFTWTAQGDVSRVRFKTLPSLGDDRPALAKAFIENECQAQLDLLIESTPAE